MIIISTVVDFYCGKKIHMSQDHTKRIIFLMSSLISNLSILGFFKYYNFFIENFNSLFGNIFPHLNIILPVGISFYTFQTMSYSIDIFRNKIKPEPSFINFAPLSNASPEASSIVVPKISKSLLDVTKK